MDYLSALAWSTFDCDGRGNLIVFCLIYKYTLLKMSYNVLYSLATRRTVAIFFEIDVLQRGSDCQRPSSIPRIPHLQDASQMTRHSLNVPILKTLCKSTEANTKTVTRSKSSKALKTAGTKTKSSETTITAATKNKSDIFFD